LEREPIDKHKAVINNCSNKEVAKIVKSNLPLPQHKKLLIIYRLEPDCFGYLGHKQMSKFCEHITKNILPIDSGFIKWTIMPRLEPEEKEVEYRIDGKLLKEHQVIKYLAFFDRDYKLFQDALTQSIMQQTRTLF